MDTILAIAIGIGGLVLMLITMQIRARRHDKAMRNQSARQHLNEAEALTRYQQLRDQGFSD